LLILLFEGSGVASAQCLKHSPTSRAAIALELSILIEEDVV